MDEQEKQSNFEDERLKIFEDLRQKNANSNSDLIVKISWAGAILLLSSDKLETLETFQKYIVFLMIISFTLSLIFESLTAHCYEKACEHETSNFEGLAVIYFDRGQIISILRNICFSIGLFLFIAVAYFLTIN